MEVGPCEVGSLEVGSLKVCSLKLKLVYAVLFATVEDVQDRLYFYALALYLFVTGQVDATYVSAAWVFVGFRALHSSVHCTFNLVMLRFYLYLIATLAVWFMIARAALKYLGG